MIVDCRTAIKQLHADLMSLGYDGSYGGVAAFARAWKADRQREMQTSGRGTFVPLAFEPGEAFQFDWSEDWAVLGGERTKLQVAHFKLSYSRAFIVRAYPLETHEMLFDSHNVVIAKRFTKNSRCNGRDAVPICSCRSAREPSTERSAANSKHGIRGSRQMMTRHQPKPPPECPTLFPALHERLVGQGRPLDWARSTLSGEHPSHSHSPVPSNTLSRCPRNRQQATVAESIRDLA